MPAKSHSIGGTYRARRIVLAALMACALPLHGVPSAGPSSAPGPRVAASDDLDTRPAAQALPRMIQELLSALPTDSTVWERYLSDSVVYVSEAGEVATKAELLSAFRPFPPGLSGSIEVKDPSITEFGDVAGVVFEAHEKQTVFDQRIEVSYLSSHVWRRESGRWRLIVAHAAVKPRDPPALPVDSRRLGDYAGTYVLSEQWRYRVEVRGDTLLGGSPSGVLRPLIPVGDNVFVDSGNPLGVLRIFVRGPGGKVERMVQRRKLADLEWKRMP